MTCDFCSSFQPVWSYPAQDFIAVAEPIPQESLGGWAACDVCHSLIEQQKWQELADRSLRFLIKEHPEILLVRESARDQLIQIHQRFAVARTGPAVRLNLPEEST